MKLQVDYFSIYNGGKKGGQARGQLRSQRTHQHYKRGPPRSTTAQQEKFFFKTREQILAHKHYTKPAALFALNTKKNACAKPS